MFDHNSTSHHSNGSSSLDREPPSKARKLFSIFIKTLLIGGILAVSMFALGIWFISTDLPNLEEIDNPQTSLSTKLISADGVVLQHYFSEENRVNVDLHEISPYVMDGLIATEDLKFYEHAGIDVKTLPAIFVRYMRGTLSGGSTITMQLARNLFDAVGTERSIYRKLKEILVSTLLERRYTKRELLTAYLNTVSIYGQSYGVEMAAQALFNKSAIDINLQEAAVLIAMLKGQGVFNPYRNPGRVLLRRNLVINKMYEYGFLNQELIDRDSILALPLELASTQVNHVHGIAPYFREYVRLYLQEWCKANNYNLYTDGLKIYTTLDSRIQKHAESAVEEHLRARQQLFLEELEGKEPYLNDPNILYAMMRKSDRYQAGLRNGKAHEEIRKEFQVEQKMTLFHWDGVIDTILTPWDSLIYYAPFLESGLVSIDPRDGAVKAWVGGIDFRFFKYDHVGKGTRQVGSTFKPFVYAAALSNGLTPCDQELNQPILFENVDGEGENWTPSNSDGSVGGLMTLREGLATSTNLITARLMKKIGPEIVVRYAKEMGIKSPVEAVPSICLGTCDLSVLELTGAYGTFANKGLWMEPHFITRIEDRNGKVIQELPVNSNQVLSEVKAYEMLELLKGTVDEAGGTANRLRKKYEFTSEIGGKTGTTQNHSDAWFVGVTPHLVSGVWVGCSDRRVRFEKMEYGQGASLALPIWAIYMKNLYEDEEIQLSQDEFEQPRGFNTSRLACDEDMEFEIDGLMRIADSLAIESDPRNSDDFENFN